MSILTLNDVSLHRNGRCILDVREAVLTQGDTVAVLGPNGAGKSSLLKIISGETVPTAGQICFHGKPLTAWNRLERARHLGVLPQSSQVGFPFTAEEVVAIGAIPLSMRKRQIAQLVRRAMHDTDVGHLAEQPYTRLSGGEKQRVQLARVLVQLSQAERPPLLLLDEPTSAQDLGHQHLLMQTLNDLRVHRDFTLLAVLHDLNLACRYGQGVWVLNHGHLQQVGAADAVLTPETVEQYWHYRPEKVTTRQHHFALL
ncbi:heme ABC transporter ATP-binding protein [Reinekea blandensis]|uniref:Hemin ABC transporter, ATP-binding protein HutD n=1 Tax=Reinekea blandensis MED297 TaxID=314283 RepID=A4BFZ9_9GAMM|nr:heme ABC transporter ATP-binding protein [Reinekea blandensis]EAR09017.1 hemin ABC transporter, ATP-binding protein HutD [Reinekea sp. MED297] [Reinekea blandensis MED297]